MGCDTRTPAVMDGAQNNECDTNISVRTLSITNVAMTVSRKTSNNGCNTNEMFAFSCRASRGPFSPSLGCLSTRVDWRSRTNCQTPRTFCTSSTSSVSTSVNTRS
jgi:hypothetical protein